MLSSDDPWEQRLILDIELKRRRRLLEEARTQGTPSIPDIRFLETAGRVVEAMQGTPEKEEPPKPTPRKKRRR